jgi:hypothetical protein
MLRHLVPQEPSDDSDDILFWRSLHKFVELFQIDAKEVII